MLKKKQVSTFLEIQILAQRANPLAHSAHCVKMLWASFQRAFSSHTGACPPLHLKNCTGNCAVTCHLVPNNYAILYYVTVIFHLKYCSAVKSSSMSDVYFASILCSFTNLLSSLSSCRHATIPFFVIRISTYVRLTLGKFLKGSVLCATLQ